MQQSWRRSTVDTGVLSTALIRSMPPAALADLRSRFSLLGRVFDVPRFEVSGTSVQEAFLRPDGPGCAPPDAMHRESDDVPTPIISRRECIQNAEHPGRGSDTHDGSRDLQVPIIPALLMRGRAAMGSMIKGWRRTWRVCRPTSSGALVQDLEQTL